MLRNSIKFTETNTGNGHGSRKSGGGSQPPSPPEPPKGPSGNGSGSRKPPSEEEKKILKDGLKPTGGAVLKYAEEHYPELVEKGKELLTEVEEAAAEAKDKVVEVIPEIVSEAKETTIKNVDKATDKTIEIVKKITSPNQMQKLIDRGQAPKEIQRVDSMDPKIPNSQAHIHFGSDKAALNMDGTWHDAHKSIPELTNKIKKWILDNGWNLPK